MYSCDAALNFQKHYSWLHDSSENFLICWYAAQVILSSGVENVILFQNSQDDKCLISKRLTSLPMTLHLEVTHVTQMLLSYQTIREETAFHFIIHNEEDFISLDT